MKINKPILVIVVVSVALIVGGVYIYSFNAPSNISPNQTMNSPLSKAKVSNEVKDDTKLQVEVIDSNNPPDYIKNYLNCSTRYNNKNLSIQNNNISYDCISKVSNLGFDSDRDCSFGIENTLIIAIGKGSKIPIDENKSKIAKEILNKINDYLSYQKTCVILLNKNLTTDEVSFLQENIKYNFERLILYKI